MNKKLFSLIFIVILGFLIRIWRIDIIPPGINRDEASIGYTAYSILKTGKDEYGTFLPLSIKSFGDWKLPLYVYLDIIPVKLLSLNELSVRFPSAILGTLTIIVTYFLILEIFQINNKKQLVALIGAFLLAISPWHIHFSRVTSEANISVFLVSFGLLLFLKGLKSKYILFLSSIILALSLYTYHASHIFTVLLFLGLIIVLYYAKTNKSLMAMFILPFVLLTGIILKQTFLSADKTKISGLSPLSNKYLIYENIDLARLDHDGTESLSAKLFHNKIFLVFGSFLEGYSRSFSQEFLFLKGGGNLQHNIPGFGNLYLAESIFIILGIYFSFKNSYKWRWLLFYWLIISPIPAAITKDAPHSARMLAILPLPHILSAIAIVEIYQILKNKSLKYFYIIVILFLFSLNFSVYLDKYYIHFPKNGEIAWGGGYKDLIASVNALSGKYSEILMDRPDYSPYIYFLFYNKTDPEKFQNEVIRYPDDMEGFQHIKSFNNLTFKKLDWSEDIALPNKLFEKKLLVTWAESTPPNATASSLLVDNFVLDNITSKFGQSFGLKAGDLIENRLIKTIYLKNGKPQFYLIETNNVVKKNINNEEK